MSERCDIHTRATKTLVSAKPLGGTHRCTQHSPLVHSMYRACHNKHQNSWKGKHRCMRHATQQQAQTPSSAHTGIPQLVHAAQAMQQQAIPNLQLLGRPEAPTMHMAVEARAMLFRNEHRTNLGPHSRQPQKPVNCEHQSAATHAMHDAALARHSTQHCASCHRLSIHLNQLFQSISPSQSELCTRLCKCASSIVLCLQACVGPFRMRFSDLLQTPSTQKRQPNPRSRRLLEKSKAGALVIHCQCSRNPPRRKSTHHALCK